VCRLEIAKGSFRTNYGWAEALQRRVMNRAVRGQHFKLAQRGGKSCLTERLFCLEFFSFFKSQSVPT